MCIVCVLCYCLCTSTYFKWDQFNLECNSFTLQQTGRTCISNKLRQVKPYPAVNCLTCYSFVVNSVASSTAIFSWLVQSLWSLLHDWTKFGILKMFKIRNVATFYINVDHITSLQRIYISFNMKSWGLQTFIKAAHNLFSMVVIIYSVGCKILTIVLILQR